MHIGFKKACYGWIVKLQIIGENNEHRRGVEECNKGRARFRCSEAKVLDIYHYQRCRQRWYRGGVVEKTNVAMSMWDRTFEYIVGETVKVDNYETQVDKVCGAGIHYYLSEEAALSCPGVSNMIYTTVANGVHREWDEDGQLVFECTFKGGVMKGNPSTSMAMDKTFDSSGALKEKRYYKNGEVLSKIEF